MQNRSARIARNVDPVGDQIVFACSAASGDALEMRDERSRVIVTCPRARAFVIDVAALRPGTSGRSQWRVTSGDLVGPHPVGGGADCAREVIGGIAAGLDIV